MTQEQILARQLESIAELEGGCVLIPRDTALRLYTWPSSLPVKHPQQADDREKLRRCL